MIAKIVIFVLCLVYFGAGLRADCRGPLRKLAGIAISPKRPADLHERASAPGGRPTSPPGKIQGEPAKEESLRRHRKVNR